MQTLDLLAVWICCFKKYIYRHQGSFLLLLGSVEETQDPHSHFHFHCSKRYWLRFSPMLLSSPLPVWSRSQVGLAQFACPYAASVVALYRVSDIVPFGARFRVKVPIWSVNQCTKKYLKEKCSIMSRAITRIQALVRRGAQASGCLVFILAVFSDLLTIPDTR